MANDQATLNDQAVNDEPSMDDTIQSTLDSIKSRDTDAAAELTSNAAETEQKPTKTRAPDGKFAKGSDRADGKNLNNEGDPVGSDAQPTAADIQTDKPAISEAPATAAPSSWTAAGKAEWAKLTPSVQQEVLKREADFHKGTEQYKQAATFGQDIHRAIQPYAQTLQGLQQQGVTPAAAIERLMSHDHVLRYGSQDQKREAVAKLIQAYGVDLSQALPYVDPQAEQYRQQLAQREQQIQQLTASQAQREHAELNSHIEQAKQGKDHFDVVRNEMAALLQAGTAKDLNEAYDMAVWARPDLRQNLLAKQQEERRAEEARIAQAAKAASASNVARRGTLPAQRPVGTMEETIAATLAKIRSN